MDAKDKCLMKSTILVTNKMYIEFYEKNRSNEKEAIDAISKVVYEFESENEDTDWGENYNPYTYSSREEAYRNIHKSTLIHFAKSKLSGIEEAPSEPEVEPATMTTVGMRYSLGVSEDAYTPVNYGELQPLAVEPQPDESVVTPEMNARIIEALGEMDMSQHISMGHFTSSTGLSYNIEEYDEAEESDEGTRTEL